jgi:hypothetical protein
MGVVQDFFAELQSYINVVTGISGYTGTHLNAGEEFTLQIVLETTAPNANPYIAFNISRVVVSKTNYAVPLDVNGNEVDSIEVPLVPGSTHLLHPFEMSELDCQPLRMRAKTTGPETARGGMTFSEPVAKVRVYAKWISDEPFWTDKTVRQNIYTS